MGHIKHLSHSSNSAGGRIHLNMQTPLTCWSQSGLAMLFRHSVGTYRWKQAHTQLIRKHLATVISAGWAIVDWFWPKKVEMVSASWSPLKNKNRKKKKKKKKKRRWGMNPHTFQQNPCLAHEEKPPPAGLEGASLSKTCFIQEIEKIKIAKKKKN